MATYKDFYCKECNGYNLVNIALEEWGCKYCNAKNTTERPARSESAYVSTSGALQDGRKLSKDFANNVLNPIMSQPGANRNRRYG